MIIFTQGNLLDADTEAFVNTVNTVGVMGKGIALMFKEAFPENFKTYEAACKSGEVRIGHMLVIERKDLIGPKWIINFPTKKHWRHPSKLEWIIEGLDDFKRIVMERGIKSVALPPLGSGNGGLAWEEVRPIIEAALQTLPEVDFVVYEPTSRYQNVAKRAGVEKLTPTRALVAELVRRYWVLGIECTLLELQKLSYFLERSVQSLDMENPLDLRFAANRYGPHATRLTHLLNALDGSYLHCDKRLAGALSAYGSMIKQICSPLMSITGIGGEVSIGPSCQATVKEVTANKNALFPIIAGMEAFIGGQEALRQAALDNQERPHDPTWKYDQWKKAGEDFKKAQDQQDAGVATMIAAADALTKSTDNLEGGNVASDPSIERGLPEPSLGSAFR